MSAIEEAFNWEMSKFKPGDSVLIRFELKEPLPAATFKELVQNLSIYGLSGEIEETMTIPNYVSLKFRIPQTVGFIWWIIPAVLAAGATGYGIWKFTKETEKAVVNLTQLLLPATLLVGGLLVLGLALTSRRADGSSSSRS